jgi:hypothetical protein
LKKGVPNGQSGELKRLRESEAQLRFLSENLAEGMVYQINSGLPVSLSIRSPFK